MMQANGGHSERLGPALCAALRKEGATKRLLAALSVREVREAPVTGCGLPGHWRHVPLALQQRTLIETCRGHCAGRKRCVALC